MRLPPAGAEPNLKPMSRARLACGASRSSVLVRKYPPTLPAYRSAILACSTTGSNAGCAPENANAGLPNCLISLMSSSRELLTGPTTGGKWEENTAMIRLSRPSTGSRYTMSALVSPVGGRACGTLSILKISSRRKYLIRSPVNGDVSGPLARWVGDSDGDGVAFGSDRAGGDGLSRLVRIKPTPARRANAIAAPTAAINVRLVFRTG